MTKELYFNFLHKREKDYFYLRKHRKVIKGFVKTFVFSAGDIVKVVYFRKNYSYVFEGICLGVRKKAFLMPNTAFILRNIILGISIEMIFLYYSKRLYFLKLQDYKRKFEHTTKNKLFYLRYKGNQASKVQFVQKD